MFVEVSSDIDVFSTDRGNWQINSSLSVLAVTVANQTGPRNITLDLDGVFVLGDTASLNYLGVDPIVDVLAQQLELVNGVPIAVT